MLPAQIAAIVPMHTHARGAISGALLLWRALGLGLEDEIIIFVVDSYPTGSS